MPTPLESQQDKVRSKFEQSKRDYEDVFSTPAGRRVLEDIKLSGGVEKEIFNNDALIMSHAEGGRRLAIHIIYMATPRPEQKPEEAKT